MRIVDLRTDTSSTPTPAMREAMACAEVGNDYWGEDPTVNRLQEMAAEMLGKEAALFVTSGIMGNILGILAQADPGQAVFFGNLSHLYFAEAAGLARIGGVITVTIDDASGVPDPDAVRAYAARPVGRPAVLSIENTHNYRGGRPLEAERVRECRALAEEMGMRLHVDGARVFNAAVALGVPAAELAAPAHTLTFCLSKGLSAPVGSVLVGDRATIEKARALRLVIGGQMRQAGVLAAAGIVALQEAEARLSDDHAKARRLAAGLSAIPGIEVEEEPPTNLVFCRVSGLGLSAAEFMERARAAGVLHLTVPHERIRFCLYRDISVEDVDFAIAAVRRAVA